MSAQREPIDKRALHDDLTDAFVQYQYRLERPMPAVTETLDSMRVHYMSDSMFHARVESLVAGVMQIINKHT